VSVEVFDQFLLLSHSFFPKLGEIVLVPMSTAVNIVVEAAAAVELLFKAGSLRCI
jgi:hypothetical protein